MSRITKPLYDRLIKILVPWFDEHTKIVRQINKQVQEIPCLHIVNPLALKIVGMGVFLSKYKITKNKFFNLHLHIRMIVKRSILLYKKKLFPLCYALQNFNVIYQIKISFTNWLEINKKDCTKRCSKNCIKILFSLMTSYTWYIWFDIEFIKGDTNSILDFLIRKFLQNRSSCHQS